jgi:hypothetical protein
LRQRAGGETRLPRKFPKFPKFPKFSARRERDGDRAEPVA